MDGDKIPERALGRIFQFLKVKDIKICCEVSKYWCLIAGPPLAEKTYAVFNGHYKKKEKSVDTFLSKVPIVSRSILNRSNEMIRYLDNSETKFLLWDYIRLRKMNTLHVKTLVRNGALENGERKIILSQYFESIRKLEIVRCTIDGLAFLDLLTFFQNLELFVDIASTFYKPSVVDLFCRGQILDKLEMAMGYKSSQGQPFKKVSINQTNLDQNLRVLLKILDITCMELEEFSLKIEFNKLLQSPTSRTSAMAHDAAGRSRSHLCDAFGLFLRKHTSTLRKLSIHSHNYLSGHILDFMQVLKVFTSNSDNHVLEELDLDFHMILLDLRGSLSILVPCLTRYKKLKTFRFQSIYCADWKSLERLQLLKSSGPYRMEFGWVCDDLDFVVSPSAKEQKFILQSDFFQSSLISLFFGVHTSVPELETILPLVPVAKFQNMKKLYISCSKKDREGPSIFCNFNIDLVVSTFPNLTELCIVDGEGFVYDNIYAEGQYESMSPATIGDTDIQIIIKELRYLQKIFIRARMQPLSDSGLTGLDQDICQLVNSEKMFEIDPYADFTGVRLSSLKYLNDINLTGLYMVTDVTAYIAFNECQALKNLTLFGKLDMITKSGKDYLEKLATSSGIKLETNF